MTRKTMNRVSTKSGKFPTQRVGIFSATLGFSVFDKTGGDYRESNKGVREQN